VRSLGKDVPLNKMRVVDATGGLGVDAFVLTCFGVHMTIIERNPIVYALLREGCEVARQNPQLTEMLARITLIHGDSNEVLPQLAAETKPHVIYLDPMYPLRVKTNTPGSKKEMVIARKLLGPDPKAEDMVAMALKYASSHVVLKRPYYVEPSPDAVTAYKARSTRFEIYSKHKSLSFDKAEGSE
jgi:16S rRNA (guanine1516-N2)-methyltransferase